MSITDCCGLVRLTWEEEEAADSESVELRTGHSDGDALDWPSRAHSNGRDGVACTKGARGAAFSDFSNETVRAVVGLDDCRERSIVVEGLHTEPLSILLSRCSASNSLYSHAPRCKRRTERGGS